MKILKPFAVDKNLGRAYNECMADVRDGQWAVLTDLDVMFLTPDAGNILHEYAALYPDAGLLTCWTNRIHILGAGRQLLNGVVSENTNVRDHIQIAQDQKKKLYQATELNCEVSGFLMMIKKETWNEIKFTESGRCLGVDNDYCWRLLAAGKKILRMDGLYVWHSYRLINGTHDKSHLK